MPPINPLFIHQPINPDLFARQANMALQYDGFVQNQVRVGIPLGDAVENRAFNAYLPMLEKDAQSGQVLPLYLYA